MIHCASFTPRCLCRPIPRRNALEQYYNNGLYYLEIMLEHLKAYDSVLHDAVLRVPTEYIPMVRPARGVRELLC